MARLKHPNHGFADVFDGNQIITMRANGWIDDDGSELAAKLAGLGVVKDTDPTDSDERAELAAQYLEKFGVAPHQRMGIPKLKEKLAE